FQNLACAAAALFDVCRSHYLCCEIPEDSQPALADHSMRDLRDDTEHSGDVALIVIDRTIGEGVVSFLGEAAALEKEQQRLIPGRAALLENLGDSRPDLRPDLLPDFVRSGAEYPVALDTDCREVSVIAEEGELPPPEHPHRITRVQHDADDGFERLRPVLRRAERRSRPIQRAHALAHLAAACEETQVALAKLLGLTRGRAAAGLAGHRHLASSSCAAMLKLQRSCIGRAGPMPRGPLGPDYGLIRLLTPDPPENSSMSFSSATGSLASSRGPGSALR